jgi:hypothetical protein
MQTRDFTYVSDSARGIILAGTETAAIGRTINLGSGAEVAINDLARAVAQIAGRFDAEIIHDEGRPGDVLRLCADVSKARTLLGYDLRVPLAEGLSRLLEWYRAQGVSPEELLQDEVVRSPRRRARHEPVMGVDRAHAAVTRSRVRRRCGRLDTHCDLIATYSDPAERLLHRVFGDAVGVAVVGRAIGAGRRSLLPAFAARTDKNHL